MKETTAISTSIAGIMSTSLMMLNLSQMGAAGLYIDEHPGVKIADMHQVPLFYLSVVLFGIYLLCAAILVKVYRTEPIKILCWSAGVLALLFAVFFVLNIFVINETFVEICVIAIV